MTSYDVGTLKQEILIALDMNMTSDALSELGDVDTLSLDEIVKSKIADAATIVLRDAPPYLLDEGDEMELEFSVDGIVSDCGRAKLPDDFLRLVAIKMNSWRRSLNVAISEDSPLYAQQRSRFAGIRGSNEKPVAAIVHGSDGMYVECYPHGGGVAYARYIPRPFIESSQSGESIWLCSKLERAVVYYAAYLAASAIQHSEQASALLAIAQEAMK